MKIPGTGGMITLLAVLALMALVQGCSEEDPLDGTGDVEMRIEAYAGDGQTERTGATLPERLTARVTDLTGNPRPGVLVVFSTAEEGAYVSPPLPTDGSGLARATFVLGTRAGSQTATAAIEGDVAVFTATAIAPECQDESLSPACAWPSGRVYLTTTSSAMISGSGSALIEFDPSTGDHALIVESGETFVDLAFSPRGELFVATSEAIFKVDPGTQGLTSWHTFAAPAATEIDANFGSILTTATSTSIEALFCESSSLEASYPTSNIRAECLTVDPVSRAAWYVTGTTISFDLVTHQWDGRSDFGPAVTARQINTGSAVPSGMCADSTGTLYVVLDGSGAERSIGRLGPDGAWQGNFFDRYDLSTTGRYGDIVCSGDRLYLIDTRNNRLLVISTGGTLEGSYESTDFSDNFSQGERYGIAAAPVYDCP